MSAPQPQTVLSPLTVTAVFLVAVLETGGETAAREVLEELADLTRATGFRDPDGGLSCVAGVGSTAWDRLFTGPRPAELHPLPVFAGERHASVSTPGDLLFHIRANRLDLCFELAARIVDRLRGAARVVDEVHGFKYYDRRDLLGFVDGTENPIGSHAADAAFVGTDEPFAGGSYVVVQKYLHDLDAWRALSVEQQEAAIGRTKLEDVELDDKAPDAHTTLTVVHGADGSELKIVRDNMPFGRVGEAEFGTYFIGYCATPGVIERMLSNMFVGDPPGTTDRVLDVSRAVTGSLFFVPSQGFLDELPDAPG